MSTLYKTEPHFIRCVVPNTHKKPGGVESALIMHQYQCNGVLAGINQSINMYFRICYKDIIDRYRHLQEGIPEQNALS